ncbi:hypothetical protein [Pseudomonas sp. GM80]|uniref:hypothetical protein n=1 Tax=Pseudomonas sp. GM80 TaxID=1144339 RepID=UPI00026F4DE2|nr:hypothetical protein [Pseudomonas sp. GM80]EJN36293.1 hypothetical protein PMI37_00075 [Pseudomonas sp. GM80]
MPWYKSGTVSVTQNSNAVIGTGTAFIANSRVGDAFRGPDGGWYEVTNIASDTAMSISPNYQGFTNAAGSYAVAPMQGYVKDSADALRSLVNQWGSKLAELGTTGNYEILPINKGGTGSATSGAALTALGFSNFGKSLIDDADAAAGRATLVAAKSGQNSDITEITGLSKPLTIAQGGVSPGYIEGLLLSWNSANSLSVGTGAAYIPGTGKVVQVAAALTLSALSLAANTWYHIYLYDNAGVAAIEAVSTAPAAAYFSTARAKNLDASRRYIGSMLTDSGGTLYKCRFLSFGRVKYLAPVINAPFMVVAGGSTVAATVDCSSIVPVTCFEVEGVALNGASIGGVYISNSDVGGISINIFLQAYAAGIATYTTITLDVSQRFTYAFDQTPNGLFRFRVAGYKYER